MKSNKFCYIFAGAVTVLGLLTVIGGVLLIILGDDWIAAAVKKVLIFSFWLIDRSIEERQ